MSGQLYAGAADPVRTVFDVTASGEDGFDLTEIESARLVVLFSNGITKTWEATVSSHPDDDEGPTETRARLTRVHESADIPVGCEGTARVRADITLSGFASPVRTRWRALEVIPAAV